MKTFVWLDSPCYLDLSNFYSSDGRQCLRVFTDGEPMATASVSLAEAKLQEDEMAIKNWSENKGLDHTLIALGILDSPHRFVASGFVLVPICRFHRERAKEYTIPGSC